MKYFVIFLLLLSTKFSFGQTPIMAVPTLSNNEKLSLNAYSVFKTNKFLDFKNRDSLIEIIEGQIFEKTDLNNYFGYKKNWAEIEKEDTAAYRLPTEKYTINPYRYSYTDSTMTQHDDYYVGQYEMSREISTVFNLKGFVIYYEKKTFFRDKLYETENTTNIFDRNNRVIKIIERTERENKKENTEAIIEAAYDSNSVTIKSKNGTIVCKLITDSNAVGFISKLSARETADDFMHALRRKQFDEAKDYCTKKLMANIQGLSTLNNQIEDVGFVSGSSKFSAGAITINDIWEIKYTTGNKENYKVDFILIKTKNGWKIDEYTITK